MKWINTLHLYQPPTQSPQVLELVTTESYLNIATLIEENPALHITLNISGSLLELFDTYGHRGLIGRYRKLIESGRVELVGTAAYHPILPLLPESEVRRQITVNEELHKKYLGVTQKLAGFYLPEMAYDNKTAAIIKDMGYQWILLDDEGHFPGAQKPSPLKRYTIKNIGLTVVFRNRLLSKTFPPEHLVKHFDELQHETVITVHDGELYGHWHKNASGYYEKAFNHPSIAHLTVSEYLSFLTDTEEVSPHEGSWETTPEEKKKEIPFALWSDPHNGIHANLWNFAREVIKTTSTNTSDPAYGQARTLLDKGLASCAWWWASERILGPFSPRTWNPTEIERGVLQLLQAARTLRSLPTSAHIAFEKQASALLLSVWNKHWNINAHTT